MATELPSMEELAGQAQLWFDKFTALKAGVRSIIADADNGNFDLEITESDCEWDGNSVNVGESSMMSSFENKLVELMKNLSK